MAEPSPEALAAANKILDRWETTMRPVPTSDDLTTLRARVEELERERDELRSKVAQLTAALGHSEQARLMAEARSGE